MSSRPSSLDLVGRCSRIAEDRRWKIRCEYACSCVLVPQGLHCTTKGRFVAEAEDSHQKGTSSTKVVRVGDHIAPSVGCLYRA